MICFKPSVTLFHAVGHSDHRRTDETGAESLKQGRELGKLSGFQNQKHQVRDCASHPRGQLFRIQSGLFDCLDQEQAQLRRSLEDMTQLCAQTMRAVGATEKDIEWPVSGAFIYSQRAGLGV